jgi:hypothetical protein
MKIAIVKLILAVAIAVSIGAEPTSAASFLEQLSLVLGPQAGPELTPPDSLFVSLAVAYGLCSTKFQLSEALANNPRAMKAMADARQCQLDGLAAGSASIAKMKNDLSKPGAQAALKDLALYWRVQMSEVGISHSEAVTLKVLRTLKSHTERIHLEADW